MNDKVIHFCGCDENGKHVKGNCCLIEDLQKEVEALRRALKSHGEIVEMNAKLKEDLKWALEVQDELNLLVGHRGSNADDRKRDDYYDKSHELKRKHKIT